VSKEMDRATLIDVARTSLCTKVEKNVAQVLTEVTSGLWQARQALLLPCTPPPSSLADHFLWSDCSGCRAGNTKRPQRADWLAHGRDHGDDAQNRCWHGV